MRARFGSNPDYLLVDVMMIPQLAIPQTSLIRGDSRSASIAAASIWPKQPGMN